MSHFTWQHAMGYLTQIHILALYLILSSKFALEMNLWWLRHGLWKQWRNFNLVPNSKLPVMVQYRPLVGNYPFLLTFYKRSGLRIEVGYKVKIAMLWPNPTSALCHSWPTTNATAATAVRSTTWSANEDASPRRSAPRAWTPSSSSARKSSWPTATGQLCGPAGCWHAL